MDPAGGPQPLRVEVAVTHLLDIAAIPRVAALLDEALDRRPAEIVIDLAGCRYVDAAGIALLLDLHRRSWRVGSQLTLRSPSTRLRRLLEIARVDQVLQVESDSTGATAQRANGGRNEASDQCEAFGRMGR